MRLTTEQADTITRATRFYLNPFEALLVAMVQAEGGPEAFVRAVQCSMPNTPNFEVAIARAAKTVRNRVMSGLFTDHMFSTQVAATTDPVTGEANPRCLIVSDEFIDLLAARWAPLGAPNDPHNLNTNWALNVKAILHAAASQEAVA